MWNNIQYHVTLIKRGIQLIHCHIKGISKAFEVGLTVVYGFNSQEQRRSLWDNLVNIGQNTTLPWLLAGDFNDVLYPEDRLLGNPIAYSEI